MGNIENFLVFALPFGMMFGVSVKSVILEGVWDCSASRFFSSASRFLAKRFQLHGSRKNGGVVRASKDVLHKLQFFMELLYGGVCGAEFVKQFQTPP